MLILSTHPTINKWKTLSDKLETIKRVLNSGKGGDFTVELKYIEAKPKITNQRIDHQWLFNLTESYFYQGYDIIGFHSSLAQWKDWGIKPSLRGSNPIDGKEQEDFYFSADENTLREGLNRFIQTCLHETAHSYYEQTKQTDNTHIYHDTHSDISGLFKTFDWTLYQPHRMLLKKFKDALVTLVGLVKTKPTGLQPLVARQATAVVKEMELLGHPVRITDGFRSTLEQDKLYAQGRTTPGNIVTQAKGGQSFHNYGVAVDMVFRKEGYNASDSLWQTLGAVGKKHGFKWGGDWTSFVDKPHFELTLGYSLKDFQENKVDYSKYK